MTSDDKILEVLKSGFESLNSGFPTLTAEVKQTNARIDETNARLDQTNSRLDETISRLDQTNSRLGEVYVAVNGITMLLVKQEQGSSVLTDRVLKLEGRVSDLESKRKAQ